MAIGHEVVRVFAIDQDSGVNGIIRYRLAAAADGINVSDFANDEVSGVIRTRKTLDRERQSVYEFVAWADDGGDPSLSGSTAVTVIIDDVNDNSPIFDEAVYNVTLNEDVRRGAELVRVRARDADDETKIKYRIVDGNDNGLFALIDQGNKVGQ